MNMNATLIGHVIWFAVFVWLTMKYIWPPIQKAMADREKQIADGLASAEKARVDLEKATENCAEILDGQEQTLQKLFLKLKLGQIKL